MKKQLTLLFLVAAICILGPSCAKTNQNAGQITGTWELRKSTGGFAGTVGYPSGNGNLLSFNKNKSFTRTSGTQTLSGTFSLQPYTRAGEFVVSFQYLQNGNTTTEQDTVRVEPSQLIFLPIASCCDIPTTYYERIH